MLQIFGSQCFIHQPVEICGKGAAQRFEAIFVGYIENHLSWLVCDLNSKLFFSQDVIFNESVPGHLSPFMPAPLMDLWPLHHKLTTFFAPTSNLLHLLQISFLIMMNNYWCNPWHLIPNKHLILYLHLSLSTHLMPFLHLCLCLLKSLPPNIVSLPCLDTLFGFVLRTTIQIRLLTHTMRLWHDLIRMFGLLPCSRRRIASNIEVLWTSYTNTQGSQTYWCLMVFDIQISSQQFHSARSGESEACGTRIQSMRGCGFSSWRNLHAGHQTH